MQAELRGDLVKGSNTFVLHRLALGKKVQSKDAVQVPIETVLSVMRDSNGNIRFDIPVEGKSTEPSFRYMKLLGKTFQKSLIDVATSPLALLGSVYDWTGGDLEEIRFDLLSTELSGDQKEKLNAIARALLEKTELELEIAGASSEAEFEGDMEIEKAELLASERANRIKEYLASQGVPHGRLFLAEYELGQSIKKARIASELKLLVTRYII